MNYMKHFLVLFFDDAAKSFLHETSQKLFHDYAPGRTLNPIEHHLTIQYFQCEEKFYPEIISSVAGILPDFLPLSVNITEVHEYINEMNDFCGLSLLAEKSEQLMNFHDTITQPLDKLHLQHEPLQEWPPHISCFPVIKLSERPVDWQFVANKFFKEPAPALRGIELRFTRWTGTHIETIHRFGSLSNQASL